MCSMKLLKEMTQKGIWLMTLKDYLRGDRIKLKYRKIAIDFKSLHISSSLT